MSFDFIGLLGVKELVDEVLLFANVGIEPKLIHFLVLNSSLFLKLFQGLECG